MSADEIIDILKEQGAFSALCAECPERIVLGADEYGPEETTCELCEGEPMEPECIHYGRIHEKAQALAEEINEGSAL